jgi:hypothetical protein
MNVDLWRTRCSLSFSSVMSNSAAATHPVRCHYFLLPSSLNQAAEFDKPSSLLSKEDGIFKSLVDAWEEEN